MPFDLDVPLDQALLQGLEGMQFPAFDPAELGDMLQQALDDPTLLSSPTFTSPSTTSPVPDEATKEAIDNMTGPELCAMLEGWLSQSHITSNSTPEVEDMTQPVHGLADVDIDSSFEQSMPRSIWSGSSTPEKHQNQPPFEMIPSPYPEMTIYPNIMPQQNIQYHQYAQPLPPVPVHQAWIPNVLPFDSGEAYYSGGGYMMDGQGYSQPRVMDQNVILSQG
ncbi:hypothetical protein BD324DRAFT_272802 [Kockovaella imperatae]|uniref:Uncharacterized protein n=1 Tax=Kockovaella imperatae TaxID=4999 RepID=A0A1Y1URQ7_9TREE|nr:hypothetical protein BD324DRAFT_272802 [Kockovaella imperatae]ORX40297.1 hypothetical protein BD324DRAFT_272802 [Kockovaella imperatae]